MARGRNRDRSGNTASPDLVEPQEVEEVEAPQFNDTPTNINTNTNKENNRMSALSPDQITALLSKTRSRGDYDTVLEEFLNSGEAGIEVDLTSGPLAGKTADQAFVGFNNARTRVNKETAKPVHEGGHAIKVIKEKPANEGEPGAVYLVNTSLVQA